MDKGKIIFNELSGWIYNDVNQAGDKMLVIDAVDLPEIIGNILNKFNDKEVRSILDQEKYDQGFHDGANKTAIELSNGTN
jgi:hypothetical protein